MYQNKSQMDRTGFYLQIGVECPFQAEKESLAKYLAWSHSLNGGAETCLMCSRRSGAANVQGRGGSASQERQRCNYSFYSPFVKLPR